MRAWASPPVPALTDHGLGIGRVPQVHDTASGSLIELAPVGTPGLARMYVCGITPYDATHLGHAATYVAFDTLQRVWRDAGLRVAYTQNVTDIDDPLLERAARDGLDWRHLGAREIDLFRSDMQALRVLAPDRFVAVTETVDLVIDVVQRLAAAGATYVLDGDVYFDVHADSGFGAISHHDEATMRALSAERGGDPDRAGKRDPLDCLLWLAARPGEPAWDSPFGTGRPGWHTECTALAVEHLGMGFDAQGGGNDLVFPHHEMSASQAQVAFGTRPFARAYVHAGMVGLDGQKMSKSRGNLVLVSRLLHQGYDPAAIRLALLAHHYRADWQWTEDALGAAEQRLTSWRKAAGSSAAGDSATVVARLRTALADDLDTPRALTVVDRWADGRGGAVGEVVAACDALLGVRL
ncbi:MAG: cysteine--1-D-myo-inosityl 2-amino-2-deoxy-alpha-D-glucopyranoside ligase [Nocardioidaceae bacterium]|nr:cysteine--1-D-myo-inosityl 2-amino-2-deoxy-alpha-D-glucopyranoside ligase [Nocardioidaceae bacterium]